MQNELILYWPEGMSPVYSRPKVPSLLVESARNPPWWVLGDADEELCYKPAREESAGYFWTLHGRSQALKGQRAAQESEALCSKATQN